MLALRQACSTEWENTEHRTEEHTTLTESTFENAMRGMEQKA